MGLIDVSEACHKRQIAQQIQKKRGEIVFMYSMRMYFCCRIYLWTMSQLPAQTAF